jgi:hypothetical protein
MLTDGCRNGKKQEGKGKREREKGIHFLSPHTQPRKEKGRCTQWCLQKKEGKLHHGKGKKSPSLEGSTEKRCDK